MRRKENIDKIETRSWVDEVSSMFTTLGDCLGFCKSSISGAGRIIRCAFCECDLRSRQVPLAVLAALIACERYLLHHIYVKELQT